MMKHMTALLFTLTILFANCSKDDKDHAEGRYECTHYVSYYSWESNPGWVRSDPFFFEIRREKKQLTVGFPATKGNPYTIQQEEMSENGQTWKFKANDGMTTFDFIFQIHDTRYELVKLGPVLYDVGIGRYTRIERMSGPREAE